jgi:hypothetical protein
MSRHSLKQVHSAPRVKQQPAAVRMLFHGLITVQVLPTNPAAAVRGPKHGHALGNRFAGVFDRMLPHTPWKAVIEAAAAVREARADLIATVGGGSVTDGAKRCKLYPDAAVIVPPRIQRLPNTHCYHVTETGLRAALFFTRAYNRLLRPGLAAALPGHRATPTGLKQAFDKIDARLTASINELALPA